MTQDEVKEIISANLKRLVKSSGLSQKDVAIKVGVSPTTFNNWCTMIATPSLSDLWKVADYFHIDVTEIINQKVDIRGIRLMNENEYILLKLYRQLSTSQKKHIINTIRIILGIDNDMGELSSSQQTG